MRIFGELMGQREVIEFLEKQFYKNPERKFTREEIEVGIKRAVKNYSLKSMAEHGDIYREHEDLLKGKTRFRSFRYRYIPNGNFLITNFREST
jgi:hypothetical protein